MSATFAWSYVGFLAGILVGVGLVNEDWIVQVLGIAMALVSFSALNKSGGDA